MTPTRKQCDSGISRVYELCNRYESGYGHGIKRDGLDLSKTPHSDAEMGEAYQIGYEAGSERYVEPTEVRSDEPVAWRCISKSGRLYTVTESHIIMTCNKDAGDTIIELFERAPSHVAPTKGDPGDIKRGNAEMHRPDSKVTYAPQCEAKAIAGKEV